MYQRLLPNNFEIFLFEFSEVYQNRTLCAFKTAKVYDIYIHTCYF